MPDINPVLFVEGDNTLAGAAAAADDALLVPNPSERIVLEVTNGGGASINVTITAVTTSLIDRSLGAFTKANMVVAVPAAGVRMITIPPGAYINGATGKIPVAYSALASVTRRAFRAA